ncbi:MAG: alginate export family protein, partial [Polymorphobacter sp.]
MHDFRGVSLRARGSAGVRLAVLALAAGVAGAAHAAPAPASAPAAAPAADPLFKPLIDMRLRYEGVDQAGFANQADALTLRVRAGGDLRIAPATRVLVEAEAVLGIVNDYNSTTNGKFLYPVVADPQNIEINRLQIQNKSIAGTTLTAGRQRINLDDQRFVGAVGFRQSEQTFDAARIETSPVKNLKIDLTYAWQDNTIFGVDSTIAHIDGNNIFANIAYATPIGTLSGFGYWVDQDAPTRLQFSSVTYGARFAGKHGFSKTASATYALSWAHQQQAFDNPFTYDADYYLADVGLGFGGFAIGAGYEVLGASSGKPFTAF